MWESRRDFQRVWEGWEAGFMAFRAFHTLSFPWPAFRAVLDKAICRHPVHCRTRHEMLIDTRRLSLSALVIRHSSRLRAKLSICPISRFFGNLPEAYPIRPGG
jgi:hypothetical protein